MSEGMTATTTVPLALSGTLVGVLRDNAHLPESPDQVAPDDPDRALHSATARWHSTARRVKVGTGSRTVGPATPQDAATVINYLHSVAEALACSGDSDARAEARGIARGLDSTVRTLRQDGGIGVTLRRRGWLTEYVLDTGVGEFR